MTAEAFVLAHTRLGACAFVPEILLHLAEEPIGLWERTEDELAQDGLPPPFWAFAWAGGLALARYLLDHADVVRHRSVLDVGAGSGLVAIAAARAGAGPVEAVEIDVLAAAAIGLNARANDVTLTVTRADLREAGHAEVILAGDVCYDKSMTGQVVESLGRARQAGHEVLIGDPGRAYLPRDRLEPVARYDVPVPRALEDADLKRATVWRLVR